MKKNILFLLLFINSFVSFVKAQNIKLEQTKSVQPKLIFDPKVLFTDSIPKGTTFKIIEVPFEDSYYTDRYEIEGKIGVTNERLKVNKDGYTFGRIKTDDGTVYNFNKVRLGKVEKKAPIKTMSTTLTAALLKETIKVGTLIYLAEISANDSSYKNRFDLVGKRGTVIQSDMIMQPDGFYAGNFLVEDDKTIVKFSKAKFSAKPVVKLVFNQDAKKTTTAYIWEEAQNDLDIKQGDKVLITAINNQDTYFEHKDDYIGEIGFAGDDIKLDKEFGGYSGSVKIDNSTSEIPYFFLVKLKKINK